MSDEFSFWFSMIFEEEDGIIVERLSEGGWIGDVAESVDCACVENNNSFSALFRWISGCLMLFSNSVCF